MSSPLPDSLNALLTEAECAQIDQTLLPTRDRFNIRLKIYAARYLSQIASQLNLPVARLTHGQIVAQLMTDPNLRENGQPETSFIEWFSHLLSASIQPLMQISSELGVEVEHVSLDQIIDWHRQQITL